MVKDLFLKYLQFEKRYSIHTLSSYETDLEQYLIFCKKNYGKQIEICTDHHLIRKWIVELMN